jgi:hypothetical protein
MAQYLPTIDFTASPTLGDFFRCQDYFQGVEGPPGSGKTIACIAKVLYYAMTQEPDKDGWRRTRWAVIRNTSVDLKTTTVQSWEEILKPEFCGSVVYSAPIRHHIKRPPHLKPGEPGHVPGIDMLVWFLGLDKPKDVRKLKSFQITGAWINEATEIDVGVVQMLTSRTGRFPSVGQFDEDEIDEDNADPVGVGATWHGIIADTNAADDENWWNKFNTSELDADILENLKAGGRSWTFYKQPPALLEVQRISEGFQVIEAGFEPTLVPQRLVSQSAGRYWCVNPGAENLPNLKPNHYLGQITNKTLAYINRFLQVKTLYIADGKPWIPEYSDEMMSASLPFDKALPLKGGLDIGGGTLQPAAVIGQRGQLGDIRCLAELTLFDIGIDRFCAELAAHIQVTFGVHHGQVEFWADPAGDKRDELFETSAIQHMKSRGFNVRPCTTNNIMTRREAYAVPMGRLINTGSGKVRPGFAVDKRCVMLRAALGGKWNTRRIQVSGTERYQEAPEKNKHSHVGDAGGYMCMGMGETRLFTHGGSVRTIGNQQTDRRQVTPAMDFSPFGGNVPG